MQPKRSGMIKKIAILFSGNGSNLEALIKALHQKYFRILPKKSPLCDFQGGIISGIESSFLNISEEECQAEDFGVEVVLALSNKANAYGITRAKRLGIPTEILESKAFLKREEFDRALVQILQEKGINLCVLAGFMRILTPIFTAQIPAINIHPSLLPLFKGAEGIKESFESPMKLGGVSVHWVSDELDSGEIIAQGVIAKENNQEDYEAKIHKLEHYLYPLAVLEVLKGI